MPVVGDVLVDTRDRQVLVTVGGADGDRGALLGARVLGLAVGQGDLAVCVGPRPEMYFMGKASWFPISMITGSQPPLLVDIL